MDVITVNDVLVVLNDTPDALCTHSVVASLDPIGTWVGQSSRGRIMTG